MRGTLQRHPCLQLLDSFGVVANAIGTICEEAEAYAIIVDALIANERTLITALKADLFDLWREARKIIERFWQIISEQLEAVAVAINPKLGYLTGTLLELAGVGLAALLDGIEDLKAEEIWGMIETAIHDLLYPFGKAASSAGAIIAEIKKFRQEGRGLCQLPDLVKTVLNHFLEAIDAFSLYIFIAVWLFGFALGPAGAAITATIQFWITVALTILQTIAQLIQAADSFSELFDFFATKWQEAIMSGSYVYLSDGSMLPWMQFGKFDAFNVISHILSIANAAIVTTGTVLLVVLGAPGKEAGKDVAIAATDKAEDKAEGLAWNRLLSCRRNGRLAINACFLAGTLIWTELGLRAIEEVAINERVWSWNDECEQWELSLVVETSKRDHDGERVEIVTGSDSLLATSEHPFRVVAGSDYTERAIASSEHLAQRGVWIPAKNLRPGDQLFNARQQSCEVQSVILSRSRDTVYNLSVTPLHNFAVGAGMVLVHNASEMPDLEALGLGCSPPDAGIHPNHVADLPFGYKDKAFRRFVQRTREEFTSVGFDDAEFFMQGSTASGIKFSSGEALDARKRIKPNDYDVAIVSPKVLARAEGLGLDVLRGPLTQKQLSALGLTDAQIMLSKASKGGLPVNFKVYRTIEDVYSYGKTIPFSLFGK